MKKLLIVLALLATTVTPVFAESKLLNGEGLALLVKNSKDLNFKFTYSDTDETYNVADLLAEWLATNEEQRSQVSNECNIYDEEQKHIATCILNIHTESLDENSETYEAILSLGYTVNLDEQTVDKENYHLFLFE